MIMMSSAEYHQLTSAKEMLERFGFHYIEPFIEQKMTDGAGGWTRAAKKAPEHDLYTDTDKDRPDSICDRSGQVVLDLCKRCGRGESELTDHPECTPRGEVLGGPDGVSWPDDLKTFDERAAYQRGVADARALAKETPIDMVLYCPACGTQHIDAPDGVWTNRVHRSHLCHKCGTIWRPADVSTNGVASIETKGKDDNWYRIPYAAPAEHVEPECTLPKDPEFTLSMASGDQRKATVMWSLTNGNKVELGIKVEGIAPEVIKALDRMTPAQPWSRGHSINYPLRAAAIINAAIGHGPMTPKEQFEMTVEQALQGEHGVVAKELAAALSGGTAK